MQTDTVLDAVYRTQPLHFWQRRKPITPLQIAVAALEECQADQLDHAWKQEFHAAMTKMLKERETRLAKDVARLSSKKKAHIENDDQAT